MAENQPRSFLEPISPSNPHTFQIPTKRINEGEDVNVWLTSWAYTDLMTFLLQLNASMFPTKREDGTIQVWTLNTPLQYSDIILRLRALIQELNRMLDDAPPDPGPRRFGNVSFRTWYALVEERVEALLEEALPSEVLKFRGGAGEDVTAKQELKAYLLGSFGSAQRLDYGTGHELSFLAFLGGIWKLGGFGDAQSSESEKDFGTRERQIVLGVIEPYLQLIRKLILTYTLEPAGSHGVWGLDDHAFLPYIFGSAQLSPAISSPSSIPQEGSIPDAPKPSDVTKRAIIDRERKVNMYFAAIGFIYDVKKGPFWEHSPMLFDISGVTAGWAKINKGMVKMFNAEVLGKFPVVQHFPFGSLFRWERNPAAPTPLETTHSQSQPGSRISNQIPSSTPTSSRPVPGTAAPWAGGMTHRTAALPGPKSSWTGQAGGMGLPATKAPWAGTTTARPAPEPGVGTAAPWAGTTTARPAREPGVGTAAPWARSAETGRPPGLRPVDEVKAPPR